MSGSDTSSALTESVKKVLNEPFGAIIKIEPDEEAPLWVDGHASPPSVHSSPPSTNDQDCTWRGAGEILLRALSSERALDNAYVSGRFVIAGDMSVMARLRFMAAT